MRPIYWVSQQMMALFFTIMVFISCVTRGRLCFRIEVIGKENIRRLRRPVILIPNHKTFADHFYIAAALFMNTRIMPMRTMAADWIYGVRRRKGGFILRWLMDILGAFPEKNGFGIRTALRALEAGQSVAIYPEGVAFREQGISDIQKGAAWLAQKTGAPLLPVAIRGLEHSNTKEFFFGQRTATVVFGSTFCIGPNENLGEASRRIKQKLEELYNENA